jgi:MSHA pilin protein MshC
MKLIKCAHLQRGFTLIELIVVLIIVGILAITVAPKFLSNNTFKQAGFAEEMKSAVRYAQKLAIAQRRFVCVEFSGTNALILTMDIATDPSVNSTTTCPAATAISIPGRAANSVSNSAATFTITPATSHFYFNAAGKPSFTAPITVNVNGNLFVIESETGYVH